MPDQTIALNKIIVDEKQNKIFVVNPLNLIKAN